MNNKFYSNKEFTDIKDRLNEEIKRRGGFKWLDPISKPKVGTDQTPPLSLPEDDRVRIPVDDRTYTINTPSEGSIEPTRNIKYPITGDNPAGSEPEFISTKPNTSAAHFTVDEIRNFTVGLSKIDDINLFYGRDEIPWLAFRDPNGIEDLLTKAESDLLHERAKFIASFHIEGNDLYAEILEGEGRLYIEDGYLMLEYEEDSIMKDIRMNIIGNDLYVSGLVVRIDPNDGVTDRKHHDYPLRNRIVILPDINGVAGLPSGEYDGEEANKPLGPNNFFDDYGALPGDGDYHPYNKAMSAIVNRDIIEHTNDRKIKRTVVVQGGRKSSEFGANPRNPQMGDEYSPYPFFIGSETTCNNACTGLCNVSCDDFCSESCTYTCTMRCGNACVSTCGNVCTGCSSLCYNTCRTKCENTTGYACVKSGAKALHVDTDENGNRTLRVETYTCNGCSYSCQFYPNKKTTCWDSGCMGKCFTSCNSSCTDSCTGGCISNESSNEGNYKIGKGRGCSSACTINCIGDCSGVCEGQCTTTCFSSCQQQCSDNCEYDCATECGNGCTTSCISGCTGCSNTCESGCKGESNSTLCSTCGATGGCSLECRSNCSNSCLNEGCTSMCGSGGYGSCTANCRMSCSGTSCTAQCSDQCSSQCSTCANNCDMQCGACTSSCASDCSSTCGFTCSGVCESSCESNCVQSCSEECGGCSELCFSCVGMCIGECSVKCEYGCSSCANNCSFWCDNSCNQECFGNCSTMCLGTCSESCATHVGKFTTRTEGPERPPTSRAWEPSTNREEERRSFLFMAHDKFIDPMGFEIIDTDLFMKTCERDTDLIIEINEEGNLVVNQNNEAYEYHLQFYTFNIDENGDLTITIDQ